MRNYHDLLVLCPEFVRFGPHLAMAAAMAKRQDIRLTGLHVRWPVLAVGAAGLPDLAESLRRDAEKALLGAIQAGEGFAAFVAGHGRVQATWRVLEGNPEIVLNYLAACHDLLVLPAGQGDQALAPGFISEVVLQCQRPCLVVPDACADPDRPPASIAIAWNGSIEALRAVAGALPLLGRAERVVMLTGQSRRYSALAPDRPVLDLVAWLAERGILAESQPLQARAGEEGEALLLATQSAGCDLLVMGAWGHTRLREWILGGATRHVLSHARLPVLMAH